MYLRYYLSIADAIRHGTTQSGTALYQLSLQDVERIRAEKLTEVALPYLRDSDWNPTRTDGFALSLSRHPIQEGMFEALAARRERLEHVRHVQEMAVIPSWQNLQALSAEDEANLRLSHPPEDVAIPTAPATSDETKAHSLVRWAKALAGVVRGEERRGERACSPDVHNLLLSRLDWLPDSLRSKFRLETTLATARALESLVKRRGAPDQVERYHAGVLPDDELGELEDKEAFKDVPRPEGSLIWRERPCQEPSLAGWRLLESWSDLHDQIDADTWRVTAPLRGIAAQSAGRLRVARYRRATIERQRSGGQKEQGVAHAAVVEAQSCQGWTARQYTWITCPRPSGPRKQITVIEPSTPTGKEPLPARDEFLRRASGVLRRFWITREDRLAEILYDALTSAENIAFEAPPIRKISVTPQKLDALAVAIGNLVGSPSEAPLVELLREIAPDNLILAGLDAVDRSHGEEGAGKADPEVRERVY